MKFSSIARILVSIAAVGTLIVPIDMLPDLLPPIGWMDDLLAAGYLVLEFLQLLKRRKDAAQIRDVKSKRTTQQ